MCPNLEMSCLEWREVSLETSELMPYGCINARQGKTQNAESILPLTPRSREALHILRIDPRRGGGYFLAQAIQGTWSASRNLICEQSIKPGWSGFLPTAGDTRSELDAQRAAWTATLWLNSWAIARRELRRSITFTSLNRIPARDSSGLWRTKQRE